MDWSGSAHFAFRRAEHFHGVIVPEMGSYKECVVGVQVAVVGVLRGGSAFVADPARNLVGGELVGGVPISLAAWHTRLMRSSMVRYERLAARMTMSQRSKISSCRLRLCIGAPFVVVRCSPYYQSVIYLSKSP